MIQADQDDAPTMRTSLMGPLPGNAGDIAGIKSDKYAVLFCGHGEELFVGGTLKFGICVNRDHIVAQPFQEPGDPFGRDMSIQKQAHLVRGAPPIGNIDEGKPLLKLVQRLPVVGNRLVYLFRKFTIVGQSKINLALGNV